MQKHPATPALSLVTIGQQNQTDITVGKGASCATQGTPDKLTKLPGIVHFYLNGQSETPSLKQPIREGQIETANQKGGSIQKARKRPIWSGFPLAKKRFRGVKTGAKSG